MGLSLPDEVTIVEMLPRDGFQRLNTWVPTDKKVAIIDALSTTGVDEIEFTSFTHPKIVPNLEDADKVAKRINRHDGVAYRALVPNVVGMKRALEASVDKVNALVTVSETYTQRNQNQTRKETLEEIEEIVALAERTNVEVEAGIGTSFYCPHEGKIPAEETLEVVDRVVDAGVDEVTLATTMGLANPVEVTKRFEAAFESHPRLDAGLHLHDTNGMSLANTLAAMAVGVDRFDASVCGLGGGVILPQGISVVGNTPTEDLVQMLDRMRINTNTDFDRVETIARDVNKQFDLGAISHVLMGGTVEQILADVAADEMEEKQEEGM